MRNIELLEKTMQFIKDNPEKHDQARWCGTAQCFAGWATSLEGYTERVYWDRHPSSSYLVVNGNDVHVEDLARKLLGLTRREADQLFDADNTREDLELMVKDLVNGGELG